MILLLHSVHVASLSMISSELPAFVMPLCFGISVKQPFQVLQEVVLLTQHLAFCFESMLKDFLV